MADGSGQKQKIWEHVNFVGWVEARNPTLAGLLGFTYVQPNLLEELIAKLTCTQKYSHEQLAISNQQGEENADTS